VKTLVVLSGKGGAGKTSVAAGLVPLLSGLVIADADVDAANMALALGATVDAGEAFADREVARVDPEACTACGACLEACRFGAILPPGATGDPYRVDAIACEGCGACALVCPVAGIQLVPALTGHWNISETSHGPLVHAELDAGGQNSGGLVRKVRQEAERVGREQGRSVILVDAPAGTGCPVISALTGADGAVLVTEPTPSGLADLRRALELVEHFEVPCGVVINKSDLNADREVEIERMCRAEGTPVLARFPYDEALARTAREGWLPSAEPGLWRRRFASLRDHVNEMLAGEPAFPRASEGKGDEA
jgi:MinD superfamily P-loop ATPase